MKRPTIGIVTAWFERGAAYVSRAYYQTLSQEFDIRIYARGGERLAVGDPIWDQPYVTWDKSADNTDGYTPNVDRERFRAWIQNNDIECVLFNEERDWQLVVDCKNMAVPVAAYIDYYTRESVELFSIYDFLLCNTERHYSVFSWHPGCIYIPWGTDCTIFTPCNRWLPGEPVRFFHSAGMGGHNLRKGTDLLVEAYQSVRGNTELIIHSQVGLDKYSRVADIIERDSRIVFIEKTVGAPGLYHMGHVYVYPARLDGLGLSVPEALACGLPVIATDTDPYRQFVCEPDNGFLVSVSNIAQREDGYYWPETECSIDELVKCMQHIVDEPNRLPALQKHAREHAEMHLNWLPNSATLPRIFAQWIEISRIRRNPRTRICLREHIYRGRRRTMVERIIHKLHGPHNMVSR